ncbi:MAG: putative replicase protein [Loecwouvirus pseudonemorishabitans]|uniref:RNA-directed RNA polymerase n=1 Tax=Leviviridae sp. TaxID=2027243 RepID=A0ABY3SUK5_9VIRU|nr:MAG: putative replicase protein [Leviviridae sp.]
MKSYAEDLKGLYTAILADCRSTYPEDVHEWDRDLSRLHSILEERGTDWFTIDLPSFGKHLDRCFADGRLCPSGIAFFKPYKKGGCVPRLFRGALLRVFQEDGLLRSSPEVTALFLLRQLCYAAKKVRMDCHEAATTAAIVDFFRIEEEIIPPTLSWKDDHLDLPPSSRLLFWKRGEGADSSGNLPLFDRQGISLPATYGADHPEPSISLLTTCHRVCDRVIGGWGSINLWNLRPKHGPGAVAELGGDKRKYAFPNWPSKLQATFPLDYFGISRSDQGDDGGRLDGDEYRGSFRNHEPPSRLIAVPKTQKAPRLIAAEPVSHQWIQQGLRREVEHLVSKSALRYSISFRDQRPNGNLALEASRTGEYATIDLSSASDYLSCWLVERVFRSNLDWLRVLHASRTRWLVDPSARGPLKYVVLKKFAPMGSALTFPIQSVVYALIAIGVVVHNYNNQMVSSQAIESAARRVRVFGDDIIVPTDLLPQVTQVLTYLGLKVNPAKSFGTGKFRESCGVDAYDGVDVTPAYYLERFEQARPTSIASVVEASNNFHRKGFWRTASWLVSTLPQRVQDGLAVVGIDSGTFGCESFCGSDVSHLKSRWSKSLQHYETSCLVPTSRQGRLEQPGTWSLLQYFTEAPEPDTYWSSGLGTRPQTLMRMRWVARSAI